MLTVRRFHFRKKTPTDCHTEGRVLHSLNSLNMRHHRMEDRRLPNPSVSMKKTLPLFRSPLRFRRSAQTRYLRWLGHDTKHFNVGKYRRLVHGSNQSADFFRADNQEAVAARHQVAALAMEDMLAWMEAGGQVRRMSGVYVWRLNVCVGHS